MTPGSPSRTNIGGLIYGTLDSTEAEHEPKTSSAAAPDDAAAVRAKQSMYAQEFEKMLVTVLDDKHGERALFDDEELECFAKYNALTYSAKFLFIRLALRSSDRWFKQADLKYEGELGVEGIKAAVAELCGNTETAVPQSSIEIDVKPDIAGPKREIIDLTLDDEDLTLVEEPLGTPGPTAEDNIPRRPDYSYLARGASYASTSELLYCLGMDDLHDLRKQMKVNCKETKKDAIIEALIKTSRKQHTLSFPSPAKGKGTRQSNLDAFVGSTKRIPHQSTLHGCSRNPGTGSQTAEHRLRQLAVEKMGVCIKLNQDVVRLFSRVNLVYFRNTTPIPLMLPAILSRAHKWNFAHKSTADITSHEDLVPAHLPSEEPPTIPYKRTRYRLWPNRERLLKYEEAIELEAEIDALFGSSSPGYPPRRTTVSRASVSRSSAAPSTLSMSASPEKARSRFSATESPDVTRNVRAGTASTYTHNGDDDDVLPVLAPQDGEAVAAETPRMQAAAKALDLAMGAYERWKEAVGEMQEAMARREAGAKLEDHQPVEEERLDEEQDHEKLMDAAGEGTKEDVTVKTEQDWDAFIELGRLRKSTVPEPLVGDAPTSHYPANDDEDHLPDDRATSPDPDTQSEPAWLNQYHHGHVLTRIICKGTHAMHILHRYADEKAVLNELLAQAVFRKGRRGRWHESRLLLLMTYDKDWPEAFRCVVEALKDPDVHTVYLPKLFRRLAMIQQKLGMSGQELIDRLGYDLPVLGKARNISVHGDRVTVDSATVGGKRKRSDLEDEKQSKLVFAPAAPLAAVPVVNKVTDKWSSGKTGKSIWKGRDDEEVTVEQFALQHYEAQGYKGLHSEGRVLTTLFALLFFDVIFAPVPGAFETPYQRAPLDIAEDTFYHARKTLADARLAEIADGKAGEVLARTWDQWGERKTVCVGLRWDLIERADWEVIAECFKPDALRVVCRTLLEDYANRTSGVPDLFIWHAENKTCKFVEVKGPGDTLMESQKLWVDVFLHAGVDIEVCHVVDDSAAKTTKVKAAAKTPRKTPKKTPAPKAQTTTLKFKPSAPPAPRVARQRQPKKEEADEPIVLDEPNIDGRSESDHSQLDQDADVKQTMKDAKDEAASHEGAQRAQPTPRRSQRARKTKGPSEGFLALQAFLQGEDESRASSSAPDSGTVGAEDPAADTDNEVEEVPPPKSMPVTGTRRTLSRSGSSAEQVEEMLRPSSSKKRRLG